MTPKEFFGRPRILAGFGLAAGGGIFPGLLAFSEIGMRLWELPFGDVFVLWLMPLVCAVGGGVAGGFVASSDDPQLRKPYMLTFVATGIATAMAGRFLPYMGLPCFISILLPAVPGAVVAFFGLLMAAPSAKGVTGTIQGAAPGKVGGPPRLLEFRSVAEEHLYMELHPCTCGRKVIGGKGATVDVDGKLVSRFEWSCAACGTPRKFEFLIPETMDYLKTPDHSYALGDAPSKILDAGQFLAHSDRLAQAVPANVDAAGKAKAADTMAWAIAAMEEVLKFIPEGPRSVPPPSAMYSDASRRLKAQLPGQFERVRLEARLKVYRDLLEGYRT